MTILSKIDLHCRGSKEEKKTSHFQGCQKRRLHPQESKIQEANLFRQTTVSWRNNGFLCLIVSCQPGQYTFE